VVFCCCVVLCVLRWNRRDVPYDWSTLLENVLDASHVPFTHHKSISNRNILGDYTMTLSGEVGAARIRALALLIGASCPMHRNQFHQVKESAIAAHWPR
jgi:phenylpropionate dioxygenase-like ring-hydroxylating dioxygenase large terminal subunit